MRATVTTKKPSLSTSRLSTQLDRRTPTYWTAKWLYNIAATSIAIGDLVHAEEYNRQAVELEAKVGNPVEALLPQINAARIAEARQQASEAEQTYRSVIRAAEKLPGYGGPGRHA